MIKHRLNTVKHCLLVEKDKGNACRKNQEKKTSRFFLTNFFRGLSFYGADCTCRWNILCGLKDGTRLKIGAWLSADTTFEENLSTNTTQTPVTALETLPLIKMCTNAMYRC